MAAATLPSQNLAPMSDQDRFFKFFQGEVTVLQERMQMLESYSASGGERVDAVDYCLSGIAKLTNEVKDASSYLPAYDQRTYGDAIKALSDKLQKIRTSFAPRQKFSFKSGFPKKNSSAISVNDAAELASKQRLSAPGDSSNNSSFAPTPLDSPTTENVPEGGPKAISSPSPSVGNGSDANGAGLRMPSFSDANRVSISNHHGLHIILPTTASHATASGTISNVRNCVVDMSLATTETGKPFATVYLKNIRDSLIVCGHVDGAVHITNVHNSVIVLASRQFRMHESSACRMYIHCGSHPIIEDCTNLIFAPLPETYMCEQDKTIPNQYNQVDDFKWLKAEHSPNWRSVPLGDVAAANDEENQAHAIVAEDIWRDIVPGKPGMGPDDILRAVGIVSGGGSSGGKALHS